MRLFSRSIISCATAALALSGLSACHSSALQRQISPLMGAWQINGDAPAPDPNYPRFTALTFHRDGTLDATYVAAAGALAGVVKMNQKMAQEHDTFTLLRHHRVRVVEGSRSLDYSYQVNDGKLYLRSSSDGTPTVFRKATADEATTNDTDSPADQSTADSSDNSN